MEIHFLCLDEQGVISKHSPGVQDSPVKYESIEEPETLGISRCQKKELKVSPWANN
jgi:hypothetical protein